MWTECPHPQSEIRRKINSANVPMCARQCVACGRNLSSWLAKKDWPANPPAWDEDEMLFDLLWLCRPCHQRMHPHRELAP